MSYIVEFILFDGLLGLDVMGPLEVFNTANQILGAKKYELNFVAQKKGKVKLNSGLEIYANYDFDDNLLSDILLIPGGDKIKTLIKDEIFMSYINKKVKSSKKIVSVCAGAYILAKTGILDDKKATTHWGLTHDFKKDYPRVNIDTDAIFIKEDNIYTSAGVTSGIDLALFIIEEDFGVSLAIEVSRKLVLYYKRPGSQLQFSSALKAEKLAEKNFSGLYKWLIKNLNKSISVKDMAKFVMMSDRNFARIFKAELGLTPAKYLERLRIDKARELILSGDQLLQEVAEISGFSNEEKLRRAFIRHFGLSPSQYRLHFTK